MVLVELLPEYIWLGSALFCLVFGGIMIFFYFYSALGSADVNEDIGEGIDSEATAELGMEADIDADGIGDIDADIEAELESLSTVETTAACSELDDIEVDAEVISDHDSHFHAEGVGDIYEGFDAPSTVIVEGSKVLLPSISGATFTYGLTGVLLWFDSSPTDKSIAFALFVGFIGGLGMSRAMKELTKGYMTPVAGIQRGNYAVVIYEVTPTKTGLVRVTQRDGSTRKAIAIGAFPHDYFSEGERGLVWEANGSIVKITREFQPSAPYETSTIFSKEQGGSSRGKVLDKKMKK